MQTVWSRIAQTRASCRCPSCATVASGLARRATTATGKRPTRYFTSSTLLYSGIFAAAATTDAVFKSERRKRWDDAIAEVKLALETEASPSKEQQQQVQQEDELDEIEAMLRGVQRQMNGPKLPASTGADLQRHNLSPQSIYAKPSARDRAARKRWSHKKLRTVELSIDKLILRTLIHLFDKGLHDGASASIHDSGLIHQYFDKPISDLERFLMDTQAQLREVMSKDPETDFEDFEERSTLFAHYSQDDGGNFHETSRQLNHALGQLFQQRRENSISYKDLLLKICYNLAVSPAPPNLACYNTLLRGMAENRGEVTLMANVIRCVRESHIRMNEISFVTILDHYIETDNAGGFMRFVRLMRGSHNGLELARPDSRISEGSQSRLIRVQTSNGTKVIQKPYPVPSVFDSLVRGTLHFSGFEPALQVCQAMGMEGWGVSIRGLTPLLLDRVSAGDWEGGNAVWRQIKLVQDRSRRQNQPEDIHKKAYAAMLRLCCFSDKQDEYHAIFEEASESGHLTEVLLNYMERTDGVVRRLHLHDDVRERSSTSDARKQDLALEAANLKNRDTDSGRYDMAQSLTYSGPLTDESTTLRGCRRPRKFQEQDDYRHKKRSATRYFKVSKATILNPLRAEGSSRPSEPAREREMA